MRLFIAQGFGIGRIPIAPGTFGSALGLLWFWLLLAPGNVRVLLFGTVIGLTASEWLSGIAETMLGQKDPGSVVLDEITAMPVCFFSWLGIWLWKTGALPSPGQLVAKGNWFITLEPFSNAAATSNGSLLGSVAPLGASGARLEPA